MEKKIAGLGKRSVMADEDQISCQQAIRVSGKNVSFLGHCLRFEHSLGPQWDSDYPESRKSAYINRPKPSRYRPELGKLRATWDSSTRPETKPD
jgi:hypothetical protein